MQVIECPNELDINQTRNARIVFLAGGISNCPDWQKEMIARFKDVDDGLILVNPRRDSFDVTNPNESDFQIDWEHRHLSIADAILFWFPFNTLCPITLYELGVHAASGRDSGEAVPLFVGCHPAYPRQFDVVKQLSLIRPEINVRDNFTPLVEDVKNWYASSVGSRPIAADTQ